MLDPDSNRSVDTALEAKNNLKKSETVACFEVLDVLFGGLEASKYCCVGNMPKNIPT